MGVLTDEPSPSLSRGGSGEKFLRIYRGMDDDDRATIRRWNVDDDGNPIDGGISHTLRKLQEHFDIAYSSVWHGIHRLRESEWEC
jgi:hypothetical protein